MESTDVPGKGVPITQAQDHSGAGIRPSPPPEIRTSTAKDAPSAWPLLNDENTAKDAARSGALSREIGIEGGTWILEIGSITISILSLIAVVIVLSVFDGKPLSDWNFYFSLNTVISALGTLSRATLAFAVAESIGQGKWIWFRRKRTKLRDFLIFDDASRGLLGSLQLIWLLRARQWATIGAIVMILIVAVDPFLQSLIDFPGQIDEVGMTTPAEIARTERVDFGTLQFQRMQRIEFAGHGYAQVATSPDFGLTAATLYGFSNSSKQNPFMTCNTGNCTWPTFTSLGICSTCADVSEYITKKTRMGNTAEIISDGNQAVAQGLVTEYSLPFSDTLKIINLKGKCSGNPCTMVNLLTAKATAYLSESLAFQNLSTLLVSVASLRADDAYINQASDWVDSQVIGTECALYLCAQADNSSVIDGLLRERILGSWAERQPNSWQPGGIQPSDTNLEAIVAEDEKEGSPIFQPYLGVNRTDLQLVIPSEARASLPANVTTSFNVSQTALTSTQMFLLDSFGAQGVAKINNETTYGGLWRQLQSAVYLDSSGQYVFEKPVLQPIFESNNLSATFENAALGMSTYMRNQGAVTESGITQLWVIHIRVRWGFISLPALVALAGCVFTLACIWETRRLKIQSWKTNSLAILAHGLDEDGRAQLKGDKLGERVIVRLEDRGDGIHLRRQD